MKLCVIYNFAQLYREGIFRLIDKEYDCDWYFGVNTSDIKEMDLNLLKHVQSLSVIRKPFYWQKGVISLLWRPEYEVYLMLGELSCISTWFFIILKALFKRRKRIYFWSHGWYGRETWIKKILKKIYFSLADGTFLYGNYAKQIMLDNGFKEKDVFVIHNSLLYDVQLSLRNRQNKTDIFLSHFKNANKNLLFIGRLKQAKRLDILIEALEILKERKCLFNLTLVGDGDDKGRLIELAREKGLIDNIWFYGACYDENANAELLYNADLCVSPGNVGLTAIHAMMFGLPVITHDCFKYQGPEFEAIHSGITGDFFERGNTESLVQTIIRWFTSKEDKREEVRKDCYAEIDAQWTPQFQIKVLKNNLK